MTISGVRSAQSASAGASTESQIARLRKQEQELRKQLEDLATSGGADSIESKQQQLTAQIQAIELQLARLEAQQVQEAQRAQQAPTSGGSTRAAGAAARSIDGIGTVVDVEL